MQVQIPSLDPFLVPRFEPVIKMRTGQRVVLYPGSQ